MLPRKKSEKKKLNLTKLDGDHDEMMMCVALCDIEF